MRIQNQTDESRRGATIHHPEHLRPILTATLASLPVTVRDSERAVQALDGQTPWSRDLAAAIDADDDRRAGQQPRAFLVLAPSVQDPDDLRTVHAVSRRRSAPVVLDHPFADDPAIGSASTALADVAELTSASVRTIGARRPVLDVLAEQILILGRLGVEGIGLEMVRRSPRGAVAHGCGSRRGAPIRISLAVASSDVRGSCQVRLDGPEAAADIDLHPADDARPAGVVLVTDRGALTLPAIHESAHRRSLRRVLTADDAVDLDEFTAACAVLV